MLFDFKFVFTFVIHVLNFKQLHFITFFFIVISIRTKNKRKKHKEFFIKRFLSLREQKKNKWMNVVLIDDFLVCFVW